MTRAEFLESLDELFELPAGTLRGSENLEDIEQWNSMAMIEFIALVDSNGGGKLSPRQIAGSTTVSDLLRLAQVDA